MRTKRRIWIADGAGLLSRMARYGIVPAAAVLLAAPVLCAQNPAADKTVQTEAGPIAIVPIASDKPDQAAKVTGALEVTQGKAIIAASGSITSGSETTPVILPHRGVLRVCAGTTVSLTADASVPAGEIPGLMMSMDRGAIEASFATEQNSDYLLTPDFRIQFGGPGAAEVRVRLSQDGDTCVDNADVNAPYVQVSSVFEGGTYRVLGGQRVMFERGSLRDVVDDEKEPCGCPPALHPGTNEFPLAQSAGLAPAPKPAPEPSTAHAGSPVAPLVYKSPQPAAAAPAPQPAKPPAAKKKPGFFGGIGRFFRRIFGGG